jgi:hypothetical protein
MPSYAYKYMYSKGKCMYINWYMFTIGGHLVRYPWSAISDWAWYRNFRYRTERVEPDIKSDIRIKFYPILKIRHTCIQLVTVAQCYRARAPIQGSWLRICMVKNFFLQCRISDWALMSISEHFRNQNDVFQSNIFVSDIGITDVNVGCRISPTMRSMSMPTYDVYVKHICINIRT